MDDTTLIISGASLAFLIMVGILIWAERKLYRAGGSFFNYCPCSSIPPVDHNPGSAHTQPLMRQ